MAKKIRLKKRKKWTELQYHQMCTIFGPEMTGCGLLPFGGFFRTKPPKNCNSSDIKNLNENIWVQLSAEEEKIMDEYYNSRKRRFIKKIEQNLSKISEDAMEYWINNPKHLKDILSKAFYLLDQH